MTKQLFDLPEELLLYILSYVTNIREKIRLASVNSTFYNLVTEACKSQNYKLINHSDYMYESEYKKVENTEKIINLHQLLRIAPRLTHFVDKVYHFGYDTNSDSNAQKFEPLTLTHTKYIYLNLCKSYFFGRQYKTAFEAKGDIVLANIPSVTMLDIRTDKNYEIQFPSLNNLKVFKLSLFNDYDFIPVDNLPNISLISVIISKAPNLEEITFEVRHTQICPNLPELLTNLAINCPNLRAVKIFSEVLSPLFQMLYNNLFNFMDKPKLPKLEYLDLRGIRLPTDCWDKLFSLTPNLKFLALDGPDPLSIPIIKRSIARKCPHVKYNFETPFEMEEEYRIYCQQTYSFDKNRYL